MSTECSLKIWSKKNWCFYESQNWQGSDYIRWDEEACDNVDEKDNPPQCKDPNFSIMDISEDMSDITNLYERSLVSPIWPKRWRIDKNWLRSSTAVNVSFWYGEKSFRQSMSLHPSNTLSTWWNSTTNSKSPVRQNCQLHCSHRHWLYRSVQPFPLLCPLLLRLAQV
jgi:hypothetical protein